MAEVKYKIIEVEKPLPLTDVDDEASKAVGALATHPGFQYLTAKLKLQRSLLETKLKKDRHKSLTDVEFIQSGIFWTNWLEDQVNTTLQNVRRSQPRVATTLEADAFQAASKMLEVVE